MNDEALKEYRQDFALAVLLRSDQPCTAGDIAEHITVLAQSEGHPDECWRGANPAAVSGHLRALEARGLVRKDESRKNGRNGRPEPTWLAMATHDASAPLPFPPDADTPAFVLTPPLPIPANPYEQLTRPQLYVLLGVHDEISGACRRFLRDIEEISDKSRRRLEQAGIEVPAA